MKQIFFCIFPVLHTEYYSNILVFSFRYILKENNHRRLCTKTAVSKKKSADGSDA